MTKKAQGCPVLGKLRRFRPTSCGPILRHFGGEIVILDEVKISDEEELTRDVLSIITVFSARLYGKMSHKNKRALTYESRKTRAP